MDGKRLAKGLMLLSSTFGMELDELATEAYRIALEDLTDEQFTAGVRKSLQVDQRMPTPAQIRAHAGVGGPKSLEAEAAAAWEGVFKALANNDEDASFDFGDIVNAVVRNMGGFAKMWHMSNGAIPFERKRFEQLYVAFKDSPPSPDRCQPEFPSTSVKRQLSGVPFGQRWRQAQIEGTAPVVRALAEAKSNGT